MTEQAHRYIWRYSNTIILFEVYTDDVLQKHNEYFPIELFSLSNGRLLKSLK